MLSTDDVIAYTAGRLADDDETERMLAAAYAACRNYCGWHVTPINIDEEIVLDGPNDPLLALPTMQLTEITDVTENDAVLDVAELLWHAAPSGIPLRGIVRKPFGRWWGWRYGSITVTLTHGFATASDFDQAVLEATDRIALAVSAGGGGALVSKKVDVVEYQWQPPPVGQSLLNTSLLDKYRLL